MKLSIITVTYNDGKVIEAFLNSLNNSEVVEEGFEAEAIVVDNASQDDTAEIIKKNAPFVKLIESEANLGFSKANNVGLKSASGEYVLFLNPDTSFEPGIFQELIDYLERHKDVGAVTAKIVYPDGSFDPNTRRNFPTPLSALRHFLNLPGSQYYITSREDEVQEIPACGGSFIMVRREVVEKIGGWDEDFFLYGEDLDYCYRIREAGWKIVYYPKISVIHHGGVSTGIKESGVELSSASKEQRRQMADHSVQAMALFYRKHLSHKHNFLVNKIVEFGFVALRLLRKVQFSFQ